MADAGLPPPPGAHWRLVAVRVPRQLAGPLAPRRQYQQAFRPLGPGTGPPPGPASPNPPDPGTAPHQLSKLSQQQLEQEGQEQQEGQQEGQGRLQRLCLLCGLAVPGAPDSPSAVLESVAYLFCSPQCETKYCLRASGGAIRRALGRLEKGVLLQRNYKAYLDRLGGGLCELDNLRTLCVACHADVTKAQLKERTAERKRSALRTHDIRAYLSPASKLAAELAEKAAAAGTLPGHTCAGSPRSQPSPLRLKLGHSGLAVATSPQQAGHSSTPGPPVLATDHTPLRGSGGTTGPGPIAGQPGVKTGRQQCAATGLMQAAGQGAAHKEEGAAGNGGTSRQAAGGVKSRQRKAGARRRAGTSSVTASMVVALGSGGPGGVAETGLVQRLQEGQVLQEVRLPQLAGGSEELQGQQGPVQLLSW
ncbi:helicase C-terminal domain-containing protein [Haematococcus lacustris]|uniref:Helicase C-terminal domain-containing protein n=1 Tax=Haematococcus lacustris TaxID=44745 RepID=A0A699Z5Z4_HAELA|nr:helicase C-terminal domain-containing protein [Haematococcus lacustris]